MCGPPSTVNAPCPTAAKGGAIGAVAPMKWRLEDGLADVWRIAVEADAMPGLELSECSVRLEPADAAAFVLPVPPEAQPVDVDAARCRYSKKRKELVIEWPRASVAEPAVPAPAVPEVTEPVAAAEAEEPLAVEPQWKVAEGVTKPAALPAETADTAPAVEAPAPAAETVEPEVMQVKASDLIKQGLLEVSAPVAEEEAPAEPERTAEEWKAFGNEAVAKGDNALALQRYSSGLKVDPNHAILLSNRALCLHRLGRLEEALVDAQRCAQLRPDFMKGFLRAGMILRELGRPVEALALLKKAPKNEEIEKISAELRPEVEKAEAERIASLGGAEQKKEQGNALFKKGLFEQALTVYDEALKLCTKADSEIVVAVRNNRAACHHQLSNFHAVVEDTTAVLDVEPDNLKALARRMLALEPLEKYERALDDARRLLRHCPGHEAANRLQHRLGRVVREQQRERNGSA